MNIKNKLSRFISLILTVAMVLTMVPNRALAVETGEPDVPDANLFKFMRMRSADGTGTPISKSIKKNMNDPEDRVILNTLQSATNLNVDGASVLLEFSLEYSQPADLVLYEYEGEPLEELEFEYNKDPDVKEDFLGDRIGYIKGVRIEDNVDKSDPEKYAYKEISPEKMNELLQEYRDNADIENVTMMNEMFYGYTGLFQPMPFNQLLMQQTMQNNILEATTKTAINSYDVSKSTTQTSINTYDISNPTTATSIIIDGEIIDSETQYEEMLKAKLLQSEKETTDFIHNIILWDGSLTDEDGNDIAYEYEYGIYIIVIEPVYEFNRVYNSFLGFLVDDDMIAAYLSKAEYEKLYGCFVEDPVDLIDGSFTWDYTDIALNGRNNLELSRHYSSKYTENDYGFGKGWTTNHTYKVEEKPLYVRVTVSSGDSIYFNMDFDGTYNSSGGSPFTFEKTSYGYTMKHKDGTVYNFNEEGNITYIENLQGESYVFTYAGERLKTISNPAGRLTFTWSRDHISAVSDSTGRTITYSYDDDNLETSENPDGDSLIYTYTPDGYMTSITDFNGTKYIENTYDDQARVITQYVKEQGTSHFTYDLYARKNTVTRENGYELYIIYDELGRIIEETDDYGTKLIEYNELHQRVSETDKDGNKTTYKYDNRGNISEIKYPDGSLEKFSYNHNNQLKKYTDGEGAETIYKYDTNGNISSVTDGNGNTRYLEYDDNNNLISSTDAIGNTTTCIYDNSGSCISTTDAKGNTTTYTYDEIGRMLSNTLPDGETIHYEYTEAGKLVKVTDPAGNVKKYNVDGNGFNTTESDWKGNITAYTYNDQSNVTSITDPLGNATTYEYDTDGNLDITTNANGNTITYTYDLDGRMTSMTNAVGATWRYTYDANGNLLTTTDPMGGVISNGYDSMQRTVAETDANGNETVYSYDDVGNQTKVTDAMNQSTIRTYDANGNLISERDRNGNTTTYIYDANNSMIGSTNALNGKTTYVYDSVGNLENITSPEGNTESYTYDNRYNNTGITNPRGFVTNNGYDKLGRLTSVTHADGGVVKYSYDSNGSITSITDELGGVTTYTYDSNRRILTTTNPNGGVTSQTYDAVGNVLTRTDAMGYVTTYTYTENNEIASITDAKGNTTQYSYDLMGRLSETTTPEGNTSRTVYDKNGNITEIINADGKSYTYMYDSLDRLVSSTDWNGNSRIYDYDAEGNITGTKDSLGYTTSQSYDALGQLISETDRNGNVRKYTYDTDGNMTSYTDPMGGITRYTYDQNGNRLTETTPLGLSTDNTYDSMDRVSSTTDPMGHVVTFFYDAKGQLIGMTNKDGINVVYTYDLNGNTITDEEGYVVTYTYDDNNRMTELNNARGYTTMYEYDKVGNLIKTTNALGGESSLIYDRDGNLISETNTDGATTTYTYDRLGRVISITDAKGAVTTTEYDANGNIVKVIQADGHSITYTYDAADRLFSYVDAAGYTFSFTYDGNGNKLSETDGNGNTTYYTYDGLDRLISKTDAEGGVSSKTYDADGRLIKVINEEGAQTNYIYDDCGRIVKITDALGNATLYTYDEMDRVLTVTDARGGVTSYTYTDRGDVATETNAEGYTVSYEYNGRHNMVKKNTVDGDIIYTYDALDRLISITTPDGKTKTFEYSGEGKIISSTDKGGHKTRYILDANGNIIETIDAMGNSALFEYDSMNNLIKTSMHRIDTQDNVDEWEIALYEFDGRGLVTREVNALGDVTTYTYDGNGNLKSKTDADGKITEYTYNGLDMVTHINYNGGKQVSYRYNNVGDLVEMNDWTGKTSFEVDLLSRITKTTDTKGKAIEYTYDEVGNQTSVKYPDNTIATKTYDLLGNIKTVTETDGRTTHYTYDGMVRISKMEYPHGWVEDYYYDLIGQLVKVEDTDPSKKDMKQQKHIYRYDDCGNMTYEYMRGNGTGEATVENIYTYDALHRVVSAKENYGNKTRTYQYDSLGNLTYETKLGNKLIDYKLSNLNQITKKSEDGWKTQSDFTYDKRGNLIQEVYTKNNKVDVTGAYTYDKTNKMVFGVNEQGESSAYLYNGLGALVENTWVIKKNAYGYHDVSDLTNIVEGEAVVDNQTGKQDKSNKNNKKIPEPLAVSPELNKNSTVVKQFVVDYTSETFEPLMEYELNGLEYRYIYGNDRLSVNITGIGNGAGNLIENGNQIRLYYHMDYLGTADYLTSPMTGKVESWTHYNEWGEITHNAVLNSGLREFDMVKRYATHDYDQVLGMYYAKARFYDAGDRRFTAVDPILDSSKYDLADYVKNPVQFVQYLYVENNPVVYIDITGRFLTGTILKERAYGTDVFMVNKYLLNSGYERYYTHLAIDYLNRYTSNTEIAIKAFQKDNGLKETGNVDIKTWEKMGFSIKKTLEEEFWSGSKGTDTLNVEVSGNDIVINYAPKIYISEDVTKERKIYRQGGYHIVYTKCEQPVDETTYNNYVKRVVDGLKYWGKGNINIQGVSGNVSINVSPTRTFKKSKADIKLYINRKGRGLALEAGWWSISRTASYTVPLGWKLFHEPNKNGVDNVALVNAHEFGHVLGVFDAYGYIWTPEAPKTKATKHGIMRSDYGYLPEVSDTDIEMMLYAWFTNSLQGYVDGKLAPESQAFFH
jgi:RHS repeat-associated protein